MLYIKIYVALYLFLSYTLSHSAQMEGFFEKIGEYPHSTPVIHTLPNYNNQQPVVVALPYCYQNLTGKHISDLPEATFKAGINPNEALVMGPLSPCIGAIVTNNDQNPKKVLAAHIYYQNKRNSLVTQIKKLWPQTSPDTIKVILHTAHMPDYEDINNGFRWQDAHRGYTQSQEMQYVADITSYCLSVPKENITVNLFHPPRALLTSPFPHAGHCIMVDQSGEPKSTCIGNTQIKNVKSEHLYIFPNGTWFNIYNTRNAKYCFLQSQIKPIFPLHLAYDQVDLIKMESLYCGLCPNCVYMADSD